MTRADIQALRAVAVVLVIAYHFGVVGISGGFVGVDIFFVVSGYLVGGALLSRLWEGHPTPLVEFFARRARRILPAAMLVVIATTVGTWLWASPARQLIFGVPLELQSTVKDGLAAVFYVPNLWFQWQDNDYLADPSDSPFLHYWSLGVEEQFYVFTPLLMMAMWWLLRRRRRLMAAVLVAAAGASLAYSIVAASADASAAFYSPLSRAWEFGAGIAACVLAARWRPPRWLRASIDLAALAVVAATVLLADSATAWPGAAAIPAVALTAAVMWARAADAAPWWSRIPGAQYLGDRSYSLYLWHWPCIVLAPEALGRELRIRELLLVAAAVVVLSELSYRLVEQPLRRMPVTNGRDRLRVFAAAGVAMTLAVVALVGTSLRADYRISVLPGQTIVPPAAPPSPEPTIVIDPFDLDAVMVQTAGPVPANLTPAPRDAVDDTPRAYADSCHTGAKDRLTPRTCTYGDGPVKVVLFGNSHTVQWLPAFEPAIEAGDVTVVSLTTSGCRPEGAGNPTNTSLHKTCDEWHSAMLARIAEEDPDFVVIGFQTEPRRSERSRAGAAQIPALVDALPATAEVVFIQDGPWWPTAPAECFARGVADVAECGAATADVWDAESARLQWSAVQETRARYLAVARYLCNSDFCATVYGDTLMYRDDDHLTATFVTLLSDYILEESGIAESIAAAGD